MSFEDNQLRQDYKKRINKVFQYIDDHLDSDLSLHKISELAFFSPFHFHRIFKTLTGETLHEYCNRRRIEKSALDLIHRRNTITELSIKYGFNDHSSYTRAFKNYYGVSPTVFRKQHPNKFSKIRQILSKNGQEYPDSEKYICMINNLKNWIIMNAKIEIKQLAKIDLAYVSVTGPQNLETAYQKLIRWATPRSLMNEKTKMLTIYHDSFKVTTAEKVRMSACIVLNDTVNIEGEIERTSIEKGKYIVGSFEIGLHEFEKSWTGLFVWMDEQGYKKAAADPFEIYYNDFNTHPEKKCIVDFCIPIE